MKQKCEICGKKIKEKKCYLNTRIVCQKCFYKCKYSKRVPRNYTYWHRILEI